LCALDAIPHLEKQGMLSRALSLATVTLLIGCFAAGSAFAQVTNLEAGKSPSQIFAGTCNACHKSPRGLLKAVPASSLPGFLRQHYTTSSDMASVLSSFLISNGATDTRYQAKDQPKDQQKQQAKQEAKPEAKPDQLDRFGRRQHPPAPAQEALTPDAEGRSSQAPGRDAKRLARPGQAPDAATDEKSGAKQKPGRRGKPGAEEPRTDEAAKVEPAKENVSRETAKETSKETPKEPPKDPPKEAPMETSKEATKRETDKVDSGKDEADKPEAAKPAGEGNSETIKETAKVDAAKETAGSEQAPLQPDPVPSVTPAPAASTAPGGGTPESISSLSAAAPPPSPTPPAVAATAPPTPPVAPAGPPAPPISQ